MIANLTVPQSCRVVGILNVTPASFSDGGRFLAVQAAVDHGLAMAAAGAELVDVGGESTRPGANRVDPDDERCRVLPVVRELARAGVPVSIDTTRSAVAAAAVDAGATAVNDVSGGLGDPNMARAVADLGVRWVITHWRRPSRQMYSAARYDNVVRDVRDELLLRVDAAVAAGVRTDDLILDPGFGFSKGVGHDLQLMAGLVAITDLGFPVLVGASRKRFLGAVLADHDGAPRPSHGRESATVATTVLAAQQGAWGVRVHDVAASVDALRVLNAVELQPMSANAAPRSVLPDHA
ncbi:dihydropteroate synthase [Mycolicibacterium sp. CBMA 226]|uniref:dihydropteroate synthase n=1 Tax=Mycolicibacterium sp. CBMA 226 TaxID=2606611 RepID=UPI0013094EB4|nr:dihydropteroate synthase [Mycolicibacterium sp. CBMA 226]MUL79001.1 dihydropteroate synthase [Mycolicibacterium sp. CBMA 226]QGW61317.1 Dihydropteroate synthase [Mycolicibacterium sp.]